MDTHIPEGMRPMLHPHKRRDAVLGPNGSGAMVVERDRSLGRAAVAKADEQARGVFSAFRKFIRVDA